MAVTSPAQKARDERDAEIARVRIRQHAGFGPDGHPEIDELIKAARSAGCRYYSEYTKFIHARLGVEQQ